MNCLKYEHFPFLDDQISGDLALTPGEIDFADEWLGGNCFPMASGKRLIAVAPGSKWESKIWNENRFYELVSELIREKDIFPIIFGGVEDKEKGDRLINRWQTGANAAGELTLRPAAAAIARCQLYVGNDTGTMHLAAAVNTPCVGIFAAIDWENRWHPFGKNHTIIRKKVACEGCLSPISFNHNRCLDLIEVKEVYQACVKTLESASSDHGLYRQLV